MYAVVPRMQRFMRAPAARSLKRWWYRCFADPYTNCVALPTRATTIFGGRFDGDLSGVVQRSIFHFGLFEPHLTEFLTDRLRPGDTFVDVGANVGYFSVLASKLVGDGGAVVAVEASPSTFTALRATLARNNATNVRAIEAAAYDCKAMLPIYHLPEESFTSGASIVRAIGPQEALVAAEPLATLLTERELTNARVIKIDVEGAEERAIAGLLPAVHLLPRDVEIVVEVLPESFHAVLAQLRERGFDASILDNPLDPLAARAKGSRLQALPAEPSPEKLKMTHGVIYLVFARASAL